MFLQIISWELLRDSNIQKSYSVSSKKKKKDDPIIVENCLVTGLLAQWVRRNSAICWINYTL